MTRAGNKEIRAAMPDGYSLEPRGKHLAVISPDGSAVRGSDGREMVVPRGAKVRPGTVQMLRRQLGKLS